MKGKWFLVILAAAVIAVLLASCGVPLATRKLATWYNIVEIVANDVDNDMKAIANATYNQRVIFLWYDFTSGERPEGFDPLNFPTVPADKQVYLNWEYVGNYG